MVDPIPEEERELEEAIREALSDVTPPPRDLCARVRLAVHAEAVREPVRARRSLRISACLSFAFACLLGFLIRQTVDRHLLWNRTADLSVASLADSFREERSAHAADRQTITPPSASLRVFEFPDRSSTIDSENSKPQELQPWHNPSIEASPPPSRPIPRFTSLSRSNDETEKRRDKGSVKGIWKHENWSVLDVPVSVESPQEPSSSIRISVTDPDEGTVRSLQMAREFRNGELHSNVEYEAKPVLVSGGGE